MFSKQIITFILVQLCGWHSTSTLHIVQAFCCLSNTQSSTSLTSFSREPFNQKLGNEKSTIEARKEGQNFMSQCPCHFPLSGTTTGCVKRKKLT